MMTMEKLPMIAFVFVLVLLAHLSFATGESCTTSANCGRDEICGGEDRCIPCHTSAECVQSTFEKSVTGGVSPWFAISMIAVSISIAATALIFMLGYFLNSDHVKRMGKAEFAQAIASFLLVALLFGAEIFEDSLITMMEKQTGVFTAAVFSPQEFKARQAMRQTMTIDPFDISLAFLKKLGNCVESAYVFNYERSVPLELFANLQLNLDLKPVIIGSVQTPVSPLVLVPSIGDRLSESEYLGGELTWMSLFIYMQIALMRFAQTSMFTIFLPLGIILRAFPPTRGVSAVMIAIAIGLYIVYPFAYTVLVASAPKTIDGCDISVGVGGVTELTKVCPVAPGGASGTIEQAQAVASTFDVQMPAIKSGTSSIRYMAWLYMIISLGAAFLFIRSISPLLGADISEIGRSMFKML